MELGFQNFSQASSLQGLSRFQDLYYPPHLYEPPRTTTEKPREYYYPPQVYEPPRPTTEKPRQYYYPSKVTVAHESFSDRIYGTGTGSDGGGSGHSPAVSALGLLSFLFFLNLIQNSVINSRWNFLRFNTTGTLFPGLGRMSSRSLASVDELKLPKFADFESTGKKRQRRSDSLIKETPLSIAFEPEDKNRTVGFPLRVLHENKYIGNFRNRKLHRFKRQLNVTVTLIPVNCIVQFYTCEFSRRIQSNKERLLNQSTLIGITRKLILLPVKNQSKRNWLLQALMPPRTSRRRSCTVLFNECRNRSVTNPGSRG